MHPLLLAEGITKRYRGRPVLEGASLAVGGGELVAIVGENGAGKTTLLSICAGIVARDGGRLERRGRVGYCPQVPGVVELLTVDEHIALFAAGLGLRRRDALAEARDLLAELNLHAAPRATARELSGGARQKLNLALALLGDPPLLLLDEPYEGFDRASYVSFWDHVGRWRSAGRGIVIVTHLLPDGVAVDRVLELAVPR
jgi:ABC-2 type transport system ATP-binding protein